MSEELFEFLDTDRFFNNIDVSKKDGCGEYTILSCLDNEISDFFHDLVIDKRGMGYQLGTLYILLHGLFLGRFDVPRGGWIMMEADSIYHQGRGSIEG